MPTPTSPRTGPILEAYRRTQLIPVIGRRVFSIGLGLKAPFFSTIRPTVQELRPGYGRVTAPLRRRVKNHLGTFHAIACCNIAELVAGTTLDATLPSTHRWIPKGMDVQYLAKATSDLEGIATVEDLAAIGPNESREVIVPVDIKDRNGAVVVHADITMWISPKTK